MSFYKKHKISIRFSFSENLRQIQIKQTIKKHVFDFQLFDKVRALRGGGTALTSRFRFIAGDVSMTGLGISDEDRQLITENVSFIYHSAATIR